MREFQVLTEVDVWLLSFGGGEAVKFWFVSAVQVLCNSSRCDQVVRKRLLATIDSCRLVGGHRSICLVIAICIDCLFCNSPGKYYFIQTTRANSRLKTHLPLKITRYDRFQR